MGRNEPCWCGQGIKWKKCHKDREQQEPLNAFDVETDVRKRGRKGYCSHSYEGDGCGAGIVKSHTVQRNGGLAAIAEGKSRVLTVKPTLAELIKHEASPPPKAVGIGDASVFPGFCGVHDDKLFKPIEGKDIELSPETAVLFGYRAIAYERFTKAVQVANAPVQRLMDRGTPLPIQLAIQTQCHLTEAGAKRGLEEVEVRLAEYRQRVETQEFTDLCYRAYRFDEILPLVACGGFMPELAIDGTRLQRLARGSTALEQLTLTITSYAERTWAVFAWIGPRDGPCGTYLDAFDEIADVAKADALIQIAFEQMENIFLRISWWEGLPADQQADLRRRILSGVGLNVRAPGYYKRSEPFLFSADVNERLSSS